MIAIGVLGIGMLMVAATFPVGIEQSRRVTDDSVAPAVADEAFASLELLLRERYPRVWTKNGTLRFPLGAGFAKAAEGGWTPPILWNTFPEDPANPTGSQAFDLNAWLRNDQDVLAKMGVSGAPDAKTGNPARGEKPAPYLCVYPSALGETPRYYWSVLYRYPSLADGSAPDTSQVEFVVFVTRGSPGALGSFLVEPVAESGPYLPSINVVDDPGTNTKAVDVIPKLDDGQAIVAENGQIFTIQQIRGTPDSARIELQAPIQAYRGAKIRMWSIPRDATTGMSPLVGVFKRTIPLR